MSRPGNSAKSRESDAVHEPTQVVPADDSASELVSVLDAYLAELQAGKPADREKLLADHPELAPQLEQCLSGLEFIQRASQSEDGLPKQLGDFRIVREVGRGGMGVVYEAEQISLRRRVALKVLRFGAAADGEAMQRFQREAETVAGLHHTNIVPIFAIGAEEGVHYYAMQFIEGRSLADFVGRGSGKDASERETAANEVANWGLQAAEALAHAHQRGVVHRDVKPSNLILDNDGRIWLTDFGLAKRTHDITLSVAGALLGTPRYMSPEQASSITKPVDHRTDIYSLGATLYELATGRPIFDADSPHAVITQILNDEPPRPRIVAPNLPRDLETIILKCLSKEPAERYQSARELADDLRAFTEDRPVKARRATLLQRGLRWVRKHRRGAAVSVVSAVATILLIVGTVFAWREYQWHHMGHVVFETDQAQADAEVFDSEGNSVRPPFSLPTRQPVSLPEGRYRVRVSAPGRLSQTYQLQLAARGNHTERFDVKLPSGELFESIDVGAQEVLRIVDVDGSTDLFRVAVRDNKRQLWRIDGATGKEIWSTSLQSIDNRELLSIPDESETWSRVLATDREWIPNVAHPAPDLDNDGTSDLVWGSVATRTLLAVSGQSGKLLWWFKSRPELDERNGAKRNRRRLWGRAVDRPVVIEIDGDGIPDLVAMFAWEDHKWIEAVSGKEGKSLWRHEFDNAWFQPPSWTNEEQLFAPQVIELNGKSAVAIAACTRFVLLDVQTGEPLWTEDLGAVANQRPRFGDLDGDGQTDGVLLLDSGQVLPQLVALSWKAQGRLWEQQLTAGYEPYAESPGHVEWPLVVDLDHDGAHEVVVPAYYEHDLGKGHAGKIKSSELEVLNGEDGSLRWRRQLRREGSSSLLGKPDRFVVGPDLDGDGCDDLFAASIAHRFPGRYSNQTVLYIDALSGVDGGKLWWWSQPLSNWADKVGELTWCRPGPDGWPMLLVPMIAWPGEPTAVHVLAGNSGTELHRITGAFRARGIDFNGDGLDEFCFWSGGQFDVRRGTGEFHAVHSPARAKWLRLHDDDRDLLAADDLDGDGVDDVLLMGDSLEAVSGETGWSLWRIGGHSSAHLCHPLSSPEGDFDNDGVGDLLVVDRYKVSYSSMPFSPLFALSGKTGERLWTGEIKTQAIGKTHLLDLRDLDGDGLGEVIFVGGLDPNPTPTSQSQVQLWLMVHSGADGRLLWNHPLSQAMYQDGDWQFNLATGDLDGDGTLDLVTAAIADHDDAANASWLLRAVSGVDGKTLWEFPLAKRAPDEFGHLRRQAPWPVVGDLNGDAKPEVVVTDYSIAKADDATRHHVEASVVALDGVTGQQHWSWTWNAGGLPEEHRPAVALVEVGAGGEKSVCVRTSQRKNAETVLLDGSGKVGERTTGGDRFDQLAGPVVAAKWRNRFFDNRREKTLMLHNRHANGFSYTISLGPDNQDSLYCELQLPPDGDGPQLSRSSFTPSTKRDPRLARPLPWNFPARNRGPWPLSFLGDVAIAMLAMGVITVIVLIVPALLIRWAKRRPSRTRWTLAGLCLVGLLAFGIFARGGAPVTPWYDMLLPGIGGALVGLPDVAFVVLFGAALFRGRWQRLWRIAFGVLLFGLLAAAVLLWYDRPYREAGDYYTFDGWYWLLPAGAYLTGAALVLFIVGRFVSSHMKRRFSQSSAGAPV